MTNRYEYLGEESGDVLTVAFAYDDAERATSRTAKGWSKSSKTLGEPGTWTGDAATAARGDAGKIGSVLTETDKALKQSHDALVTYANTLATLWGQVWDLNDKYNKQQAIIDQGYDQLQALHGQQDRGTPAQQTSANNRADAINADIAKAQKAIDALDAQYTQYKTKQSNAAHTCATALTTLPGKPGVTFGGKQGLSQLTGALGVSDLKVAGIIQSGKDAKQAAADAKKLAGMDPQSPEAIKLAKELQALLDKHKDGDPYFSVPFLKEAGQDTILKLTTEVAGLSSPDPDVAKTLADTAGAIQRDLGTDLAAATHLLGKPNPDGIPQLDQAWVNTLLDDGKHSYQTHLGGYYYDLKGFQSLGILMRTGDYGANFLNQSGDAMMAYEKAYPDDGLKSNVWMQTGGPNGNNVRLWWGAGDGPNVERGVDPFNGWTAAVQNSSEGKEALYDDVTQKHGLLQYLLDDRDWSLRDTPSDSIMGHYEAGETRPGLLGLGSMLDHVVQGTGKDPQSQAIYEAMVHDLGDSDLNHRIGSGKFGGDDWIPPELRPSLGDIVAKNIDLTHNTLAGQDGNGGINELEMKRVLMDLGKDHGDGGAADTIKGAEAGYVRSLIAEKIHNGDQSYQSDGTGMAKLFAGLDFGKNAEISQIQADADAAHNKMVDEIVDDFSSIAGAGAGAATDEIPGAGVVTDWLIGHTADAFKDALHHDGSALVAVQGDNASDVSRHTFDNVLRQAAVTASVPHDVLVQDGLIGPDGQMIKLDDSGIGSPAYAKVVQWMKAHGQSDLLNLAPNSETAYSAIYGEDAAHYLDS